jgi:hypothetical protein
MPIMAQPGPVVREIARLESIIETSEGETAGPLNYALGYDKGFVAGRSQPVTERESHEPLDPRRVQRSIEFLLA